MDSEVLDVMRELGCFSAGPGLVADLIDDEQDPFDELWIDLGGEG